MTERIEREAYTFDDVLLVPRRSSILPREVDVSTRFSKRITMGVPIVSSPMDTVTEAQLAIALARLGGMGIIHKNMSIEEQAAEVDRVKRSESGMISDPMTLTADQTIGDALAIMAKYHISGLPVVERKGGKAILIGILTNRDIRFETDKTRLVRELMTRENLVTAPVGTSLEQAQALLHKHRIEKLPIVDEEGCLRGLITVKDIQKRVMYPDACKDAQGRLRVGAAVGVNAEADERAAALVAAGVDAVVIDSAHGHSEGVIQVLKRLRPTFADVDLVAGNVATRQGAEELAKEGCDAVKVGMGPGSICTTRVIAGIGVPQITAVMDAVAAASGEDVPVIADGGIRFSGDISKALAAGADSVMLGNLLAGTDEAPGEELFHEGRRWKVYRAMGSVEAMSEGSRDRYRQEGVQDQSKLVPEGIVGRTPYRGSVAGVIYQLTGGLRSGMGYLGARTIKELQEVAEFIRISPAGVRESHPHDISILHEAPNYQASS
jgi:IMP dehydrogenase